MEILPSLDAHGHLAAERTPEELASTGAVLAMTLSLDEAAQVVGRADPYVTWGVGCHPRKREAQEAFDAAAFFELARRAAIVGEVGLDEGSHVPLELQLQNFRAVLDIVAGLPRLVSIHSWWGSSLICPWAESGASCGATWRPSSARPAHRRCFQNLSGRS